MFGRFDPSAFKVHLKTAIARMQLQRNKKSNLVKMQKREIAALLEKGKDESARIKVEHVIREDFATEALEILELFCDLLLARLPIIKEQNHLPSELAEAVHTLIYASYRVEVVELQAVREDLAKKYDKKLLKSALENADGCVNPRVINKLATAAPEQFLVLQYLKEIARAHNIEWEGGDWQADLMTLPMPPGGHSQGPHGGGGGGTVPDARMMMLAPYPASVAAQPKLGEYGVPLPQAPVSSISAPMPTPTPAPAPRMGEYGEYSPPAPSRASYNQGPPPPLQMNAPPPMPVDLQQLPTIPSMSAAAKPQSPTAPSSNSGQADDLPDFDELTRRFEALKRRE